MIRGLYLKEAPEMNKITQTELLEEFDPIEDCTSSKLVGDKYSMVETECYSDHYKFQVFSLSTKDGFETLWGTYRNIESAEPRLLKVIRYSDNSFIVATPIKEDELFCETYSTIMDELVRFSAFCDNNFPETSEKVSYIKSYIRQGICWPGNSDNIKAVEQKDDEN